MVVCSSALETLRSERAMGRSAFMDQNRANEAVRNDITSLLRNKSLSELRHLQESVKAKLSSGDPIDVEYWEGLLKELAVWMAKAKLKTMHEVVLRNRLEHLRRKQRDEAIKVQDELTSAVQAEEDEMEIAAEPAADVIVETKPVQEQWDASMAPKLVTRIPMEDQHLQLLEPKDELILLVSPLDVSLFMLIELTLFSQIAARRLVAHARFVPKKNKSAALAAVGEKGDAKSEALVKAEASKGLDEDEEVFMAESELKTQAYSWQDKYRPRKPRYFNKVITGFEWNKYNQTHYE